MAAAPPSVIINLEPVVLQRVEASISEERNFVINPFDLNGNVLNSIYVEVVTNVTPPAEFTPLAPASVTNVVLPDIASLKGNSNIKITIVNIDGGGQLSAVCGGADTIGGGNTISTFGNMVLTIANNNTWACLVTESVVYAAAKTT